MSKTSTKISQILQISEIELLLGGSLWRNAMFRVGDCRTRFYQKIICNCLPTQTHSAWGIAVNEAQRMALELGEKRNRCG